MAAGALAPREGGMGQQGGRRAPPQTRKYFYIF